jgi:hypothetical protein
MEFNMSSGLSELSERERIALGEYKFADIGQNHKTNKYLLGVQAVKEADGRVEIVAIPKKLATLWNLIKSWFNCGDLAGISLSLKSIKVVLLNRDLSDETDTNITETIYAISERLVLKKDHALQQMLDEEDEMPNIVPEKTVFFY